jgi:hypothetical protein
MAKCLQVLKACQPLEARLDYGFYWTREFTRRWEADRPYDIGIVVRPSSVAVVTGFEYISSGGQSGAEEPNWPRTLAGTIVDGSITWTAQALSTASLLETVATDTWSASDPVGLTVEAQLPIDLPGLQRTSVVLSEGSVGVEYAVDNEVITATGKEFVARVLLTVV